MNVPTTITIKSDGNIISFEKLEKGMYIYRYSKSKYKKDQLLGLTEAELQKLIKTNS